MILIGLTFYVFAAILVASALMVIASRNPVHSVLYLILSFFTAAGLFILIGAEFLAMILVIVYVGAVAVLFLFVVMMLDINFVEMREGFLQYLPVGGVIGLILLVELIFVLGATAISPEMIASVGEPTPDVTVMENTRAIGVLIYTKYIYAFQVSGLILLVAMIGAIVLTLRKRDGVKRQSISSQTAKDSASAIEIKKVETGQGF
jgi:NADH-quinone oxidoreductase subunit J